MKKIVAVFMVLIMLIGIGSSVIAEPQQDFVKVSVNGKEVSVRIANIIFNGKTVESDVPPIIINDRTLVPIRFIADHLNADVTWNQQKKEATIKTSDKEIILKINSPTVTVNGENKKIPYDLPAMLVNDARTMVPLRFVSEILGCEVEWEQSTRTGIITTSESEVTGISIDKSSGQNPKIILNTKGQIEYTEELLTAPNRLVIDIQNSKLNISDKTKLDSNGTLKLDVDQHPIKDIRVAQFSNNPNAVRIVIDLDEPIGYTISKSKDNQFVTITFLNNVKDISLERVDRKEAIVIENSDVPKYNMFRLSNPERLVIDLQDSTLWKETVELDIKAKFIKGVRTSQFKADSSSDNNDKVVRIVLDIDDSKGDPNFRTEVDGNNIILFTDDETFKNISYTTSLEDEGLIKIFTEERTDYSIDYNKDSKQMEIKINKDDINLENGLMTVKDNKINSIVIDEDEDYKSILIKFNEKIKYNILSAPISNEINIAFNNIIENDGAKLIVIDAGHGGKDPGTIGPITKVKEKDLNLKVALKLDKKLRDLGFRTILTRDKDEFIELDERAEIANRNDADAFISIHFNSNNKKDIAGIQTYYCPAFDSLVKEGDNHPFAKTIHDAMLKGLNNKDRGIIKKPGFVVINKTKMVATLLELGFVTNPEEEKLLITDAYHEKAAQAIADGIVNYFKK